MKIVISAESTIDMPKELLNEFNIKTLPFTVIMGDKDYLDGEIDNSQIFEFVSQTKKLPKTSAINKFQYEEHFKNLLKDYDAVIHFTLSSEMSCAHQNAKEVASNMQNVYVIDSRSLSTGIALLAIKASELVSQNVELEEIFSQINKAIPKVQASFILDKLQYLAKGGRCSSLTAFGANVLSIKPQILVKDGKMQVGKKYMGKYESASIKYFNDIVNAYENVDTAHAFITKTTATEQMIEQAKQILQNKGFKNIHITTAGGTISSHCGPNTIGLLFIGE